LNNISLTLLGAGTFRGSRKADDAGRERFAATMLFSYIVLVSSGTLAKPPLPRD
jgi:hypothetical protein